MKKTYHHSSFSGEIQAPLSKSYTQRAIAIATMANGETHIINPAFCDDTEAAIKLARGLGAHINIRSDLITVKGNFKGLSSDLSAGESGLALRMFSPIIALLKDKIKISGIGSLLIRPVSMIEKPLISLGVKFESRDGFLPVQIQGPLNGGSATIDGSLSSQFLTGLLMALPLTEKDSFLNVTHLQSTPYIDMTLEIMEHFGVKIINENYQVFKIRGNQNYISKPYVVEGDWSNAAFHLVGGAISGRVEITGLTPNSKQADVAILKALDLAGAFLEIADHSILVKKSELKSFEFDATHCPDLFPPLAVLAAASMGTSKIKGTNRLIHKESNRAIVLQSELGKIGINIKLENDVMIIYGETIKGGIIDSNNDHRIAMAGTIASLISKNPITIQQAEAVNKSYPDFYKDFEILRK